MDGSLEQASLVHMSTNKDEIKLERSAHDIRFHGGEFIKSLSSDRDYLLSLSSSGTATLEKPIASLDNTKHHSIDLQRRSWSSHLSLRASTPFVALGTSSHTPLTVHSITNFEFSSIPSAILQSHAEMDYKPSAVYGISSAPPSSPWGSSEQVLVSGWYDGAVHLHDLRSSDSSSLNRVFNPVLSMHDPWLCEPIYTVSCGGGSGNHVAAGSARHGVVSFWDVRSPKRGWSVHAPGNDPSPVYDIILESSRLFGATERRPFVYDFGSGISHTTYPRLPSAHPKDGLKRSSGVGYYVTIYNHRRLIEGH